MSKNLKNETNTSEPIAQVLIGHDTYNIYCYNDDIYVQGPNDTSPIELSTIDNPKLLSILEYSFKNVK